MYNDHRLSAPSTGTRVVASEGPAEGAGSLTVLSYGGGQDSTAMLYKYAFDPAFRARYAPGRFLVVMAATGDEHPETDRHVVRTKRFCAEHGIEFVHITPDMGFHRGNWTGYREFLRATRTCGSKAFLKTCTDNLKMKPIHRFLEDWLSKNYGVRCGRKTGFKEFAQAHGKIRVLIGIAKGEESRIGAPMQAWAKASTEHVYPLIDLEMDRQACQDYIQSVGQVVPPPSNCMLCPFLSEIELLWLNRFHPADYAEWVEIEQAKVEKTRAAGKPEDKNFGVWGRKMLPVVLEKAKEKFGHLTDAQLHEYKQSHGHCVKSKY